MFRQEDRRAHTGSGFGVRVAVLSGIALIAFSVIFFRLWYLEVLSGEAYLKEANSNRVRELPIQAPRGDIQDANGKVLVENRSALSLQVRPDKLPENTQARNKELRKLADAAEMKPRKVKREIREQTKLLPASPVTLKADVDQDLVRYLRERQFEFPGVTAEEIYVRKYPEDTLAAHMLGYVSEASEDQLEEPQYASLGLGDRIGATGLEAQYDNVLRGRNGAVRVQVNAMGQPFGQELSRKEPDAGENLVLTLDEKIQKAGEQALADYGSGLPGAAFVVMDIEDGSVLGMGSYPTFDPSVYTPPASSKEINQLVKDDSDPLYSKATQSVYPTGSTFKPITATAGLESGLITPTELVDDAGVWEYGGRDWINAGSVPNGAVDMTKALAVSSDIYFYKLGLDLDLNSNEQLQKTASQFGFGSLTGIDLPGEQPGLLPTPDWRNELFDEGNTDRPWTEGDNMNLSVGQGDLQATPLQLATAYAAIANGGEVVRPHIADHAENALGEATQEFDPAPSRQIDLPDGARDTIMEGLREAAMEPGGTSSAIFAGYPVQIAGKTGTAETSSGFDQSWYAAIAPADRPKYVVVSTFENGGFGAETAAPAVRDILNTVLNVKSGQIEDVGGTLGED